MAFTKVLVPKVCEHCGKPFMAKTTTTHFCSKVCNQQNIKARKKKEEEKKRDKILLEQERKTYIDIQTRPYITVSEASKLFGISQDTIRRLIRKGMIRGKNLGIRLTWVDRESLEKFYSPVDTPYGDEDKREYTLEECYTIGSAKRNTTSRNLFWNV